MSTNEVAASPDVESLIQKLLAQKAEIQKSLDALLINKYALDSHRELSMLRHKLDILQDVVEYHGKQPTSSAYVYPDQKNKKFRHGVNRRVVICRTRTSCSRLV